MDRRHRPAFTLIELLVVVAIIALLISILLPSLKRARESARAAVCGTTLRGMATGLTTYFTEQNGWIPGFNTSGVASRVAGITDDVDLLRKPSTPVQAFDWITPWLRYETNLPANRARRFQLLLDEYSCPSVRGLKATLYLQNKYPDASDFDEVLQTGGFQPLSYLMPAFFQYWGENEKGKVLASPPGIPPWSKITAQSATQGIVPNINVTIDDYQPRIEKIGPFAARKIMVADGTRYMIIEGEELLLDFDARPQENTFGPFTCNSAWWSGSTAYGPGANTRSYWSDPISRGSESDGLNLPLSYRHGEAMDAIQGSSALDNGGAINAVFFDGHVASLNDRESREIELWHPSGSEVKSTSNAMTEVQRGSIVP